MEDDLDFNPVEFEIDFMIAMFMLNEHDMTYDDAKEKALLWYKEARE
jgi:hypothetical protein